MAGRGSSDLELMKERARREREEQARQLQRKLIKEQIPSGESDLFAAPVRAKGVVGDKISMQAQKALGQFSSEIMSISHKMSLYGVDEQPMTPLPTHRHENPLASATPGGGGGGARKDLFKERKHVTYGEYLKHKQKQESSSANRSSSASSSQKDKSESGSKKESNSQLPGIERSSSAPRKSSKERPVIGQSANVSHLHSKPQNQVGDQHNSTKPHGSNGISRSPSPCKKTPAISTTPKQEEILRAKNNLHETLSSKSQKDAPHAPRNGMMPVPNGVAKHMLKPKLPPLAKLDIKEAQQNQVENTDVESILKEMTVCAPLTAIQTPRKEEAKFPFPATSPIKNHVVESSHPQTKNEEPKDIITPISVNDVSTENRFKSEKERTKESQEVTPNVPRPRAKPTAPSGGGGGGANAPMKEPRSTPASSDSEESSDNENDSSGDSNDDSSSSSLEEDSDKEDIRPRQPISPLISPPAKPNESKNSSTSSSSSWALESIINHISNTQSPITPLSTSLSSRGSDKKHPDLLSPPKDENDEMISKLIKSEIIDKDDGPLDTSQHSERPSSHTPTSASIKGSKSATPKSPRVSQPSHNAHKSHDKKHERTSNSSLPSRGRKSSHSSEASSTHKSQSGGSRTPQKEFKSSTPNSKANKHRSSYFKSPAKHTLTDSEESDVDIESVTPGKEATQKVQLEKALEKADVTKRLSFSAERSSKSESAVKSENVAKSESAVKSENVVKSESAVKSEHSQRNRTSSKLSSKSKERTKEKSRKQRTSADEKKNRNSLSCDSRPEDSVVNLNGSVNESIEKDVRNIFNEIGSEHHLLSPIPDHKSTISLRTPTKNVLEEPKCLTYKNGKPSLMVHLKLSLLPKPCDLLPVKKEIKTEEFVISPLKETVALPQNPVIGSVSDDNTTEYGDSDMDIDSPDSTFRIETSHPPENAVKRDYIPVDSMLTSPFENRQSSPALSSHSPRHRKSFKRKQDSDRTDDIKRPKSLNTPYSKEIESPQKEKESHKDSRNWDRKHPQRSEVKVRRDSSSSVSSQSGSTVVKQTKTQGNGPEEPEVKSEVKVNDLEEKVEDLVVVHDPNVARFPATNGYPSSNEMQNWLREGDRDGDESIHSPRYPKPQKQRLEERLESADTYLAEAKKLKHQADNLYDKPAKTLMYLEAVLSFIQCGYAMEKEALSDIGKIHKMYMETYRLISYIFRSRSSHDFNHNMTRKERILAVLSLRVQSLLSLKLFKLRKTDTLKLKRAIDEHNKPSSKPPPTHAPSPHQSNWNGRSTTVTPSHTSPTPSPAGSIGSVDSQGSDLIPSKHPNGNAASCVSMSSPAPGMVSVPQRIHSLTQQYLNMTNFLVQCHDYWDQADTAMHEYQEFFDELDGDCGPLSLHSGILDLVFYVQTGLKKLKEV